LYIFPISEGITNAITGVEDDPDHEAQDSSEAFAGVLPHLLLGLEDPVPAVEAERDDKHENPEADSAWTAERTRVTGRAHLASSVVGSD
jgi:hypothetical protein